MVSSKSVTLISYGNGKKKWVVDGVFCRGFCEKWCAERGFLMVRLWWMRGKRGEKNAVIPASKIRHFFKVYFEGKNLFRGIKCSTLQLKRFLRGEDDFQDSARWMLAGGLLGFGFGAGELL
jgi:hypothetical protein